MNLESDGLPSLDDYFSILTGYHEEINERHLSDKLEYDKAERCTEKLNEWIKHFYGVKEKTY